MLDVYGVGNALVDIQAQVADEVIARLDYNKGAMTLVDEATQKRVLALAGSENTADWPFWSTNRMKDWSTLILLNGKARRLASEE